MKTYRKKLLSCVLAAGMVLSSVPQVMPVYAVEVPSANYDLAHEQPWNLEESTNYRLSSSAGVRYSTITVPEGMTLNIKGTGVLYADRITGGGKLTVTSGNVYVNSIDCSVSISGGNVIADEINSPDAVYQTGGELTVNRLNAAISVSEGILRVDEGIRAAAGSVSLTGGTVRVSGGITAGDDEDNIGMIANGAAVRSGGNVTLGSKADIIVNGDIRAGKGSSCTVSVDPETEMQNVTAVQCLSAGGNVYIYSGTVNGSIFGGEGGSGLGNVYGFKGANGGDVYIYGGTINGNVSGGRGGNGSDKNENRRAYPGGNCGNVTINGGVITAPEKVTVSLYGLGGLTGETPTSRAASGYGGTLSSSADGTGIVRAMSLPSRSRFLSGIINNAGDVEVYGKQTLSHNYYEENSDSITVMEGAELTISGTVLTADGTIENNGHITVNADAGLIGDGTYFYDSFEYPVAQLRDAILTDFDIPEGTVYNGQDRPEFMYFSSTDSKGITFLNMNGYESVVFFARGENEAKYTVETVKDAGYYNIQLWNGGGSTVDSKSFEIVKKNLTVTGVSLVPGTTDIAGVKFGGICTNEYLEYGTDYTAELTVVGRNVVSGNVTLLETPIAMNYYLADDGAFENVRSDYDHVHRYDKRGWDSAQHWYECECGRGGNRFPQAHIKGEGVITKQPTIRENGIRSYLCTVCGYVMETEEIDLTDHTHSYSDDWSSDETRHWHECLCGEKRGIAVHTKDDGVVTRQPTTSSTGIRTYSCTVCRRVLETEEIEKLHTHHYSEVWKTDDIYHWYECECGSKRDQVKHTSDNGVITVRPTETATGVRTYSCTVCGHVIRSEIVPKLHEHKYSTLWSSDGTYHWHECSCGEKEDISVHYRNNGIITKQPTHTENGEMTYSCANCGHVMEVEIIPMLHDHEFSTGWINNDNYHWHECSCGEKGSYAPHTSNGGVVVVPATESDPGVTLYFCTDCGRLLRKEISAVHSHDYGTDWISNISYHWHECFCGTKKDMAQHVMDSGRVTKQPTESETGIMTYSCTICGQVIRETEIPKTAHSHQHSSKWFKNSLTHWHECECGDKVNIASHTSNGGVITRMPTEFDYGIRTYSCTVCGYIMKTETVAPTHSTHSYSSTWSRNNKYHWHACTVCGDKGGYAVHNILTAETPAAASSPAVRKYYCRDCGYVTKTETIAEVHSHVYDSGWVGDKDYHWHSCACGRKTDIQTHTSDSGVITKAPTDLVPGVKTYSCTVCGEVIKTEPVLPETHTHDYSNVYYYNNYYHWRECACGAVTAAETHISDGGKVTRQATDDEAGVMTYSCSVCGYIIKRESVPPHPAHVHSFSTHLTSDEAHHWYECECGARKNIASHRMSEGYVTVQPTAISAGTITYYCLDCGYLMEKDINHTHEFSTAWRSDDTKHWHECWCGMKGSMAVHVSDGGVITRQPTATTTGVMTYSCTVCGQAYKTEVIPIHTHSYSTDWKHDADYHWHQCITCGGKKDYALHISNGGIITRQPTAVSDGVKTFTCTVCGYIWTESISAHSHYYPDEWTADPSSHWRQCSCGNKTDEAAHIKGTPIITKQPTATENGIRVYNCTVCGYRIAAEEFRSELAVTVQPTDISVMEYDNASFTVSAIGDGLTYNWQVKDGSTWRNTGCTSARYDIFYAADSMNGRTVRCGVTDIYGNRVYSDEAVLSVTNVTVRMIEQMSVSECAEFVNNFYANAERAGIDTLMLDQAQMRAVTRILNIDLD